MQTPTQSPDTVPTPDHAGSFRDPQLTWRIRDDRRLPALEPYAPEVQRLPVVTVRETIWDSDDRVLRAAGVELAQDADGAWWVDRGDGPEAVPEDVDAVGAEGPPRHAVEVHLRGRGLGGVAVRDTTTRLLALRGKDGRLRVEVADVVVDEGDPATALLRSARWWAYTDDGHPGAIARSVLRALSEAAEEEARGPQSTGFGAHDPGNDERRAPAGRRPREDTALGFVVEALQVLRGALVAADPHVRVDDEESVHDLRKALRRIRSVLAAYRGALDRDATESLRVTLGELGRIAGNARDAEVLRNGLLRSAARAPQDYVDATTLERLDDHLAELRAAAAAELRRTMRSTTWFEALDALDALIAGAPPGPHATDDARTFTAKRIERERRRVRRAIADRTDDPGSLHAARKAARRLRYALEAAGRLPDVGPRRLGLLSKVQDTLGEALDAVHAADGYRQTAELAARRGEDTFAYGVLATVERERAERGFARAESLLAKL